MANTGGRLARAYTGSSSLPTTEIGFVYSVRGELTEIWESTPNSGGYYHPTSAYRPNGALSNLWISNIPSISYGVDGEGRTSTVSATSGTNPVTAASYNVANQLTSTTFGSGDSISFTYDANTGRMTQYKLAINGTGTYGNLTWNANGTLQQLAITDPFNSADAQTCTYLYDDLGRVGLPPGSTGKSVDCGASIWQQNFSYDAFGNLTKTIPSGGTGISWQPTYGSSTNRYTAIPGATPSYDADGNLTNDSFHSYAWDAEGRPVTVDALGLTYDALGRMVEVKNGTNYTQYVWWPSSQKFVIMNGQNLSSAFVPLPGGAEVKYTSTGLSVYRMPDWLGSLRAASNPNRTYNGSLAFAPFGERYAVSGTPAYTFTGQRADTVTDEYDFVFRKYHSSQGRWISPDPAGLAAVDPTDPQTWNRYAYVGGNPLGAVDASGLYRMGWAGGCPYLVTEGEGVQPDYWEQIDCLPGAGSGLGNLRNPVWDDDGRSGGGGRRPAPNPRPPNAANNGLLSNLKNLIPSVCSGGGFAYGGGEVEKGPVKAELIGVVAYDSKGGGQHGGIVAGGIGPFTGGIESTRTWSDWQEHTSNIGFVNGASAITPRKLGPMEITKSNYGGLVQFNNGQLTVGGYAGLETRGGRAFGTGGYLTLSWSGCH